MTRPSNRDTNSVSSRHSSLRRALGLLDSFTAEQPELSIRELAARADLPRSTAHRLARDLVEWGALERTTRGLRLGLKLFELGTMAPAPNSFRGTAEPFARHLHEVTRLTVNLAVRRDREIVYLDKISTRSLRVPHSRLGGRGALHATALGKAILAFSPAEIADPIIEGRLELLTPHTIVTAEALRRELAQVRERRVSFDVEESRLELFCVAAPVLNTRNHAVGAVSVTGATALDEAERYAAAVQTTALAIARLMRKPQGA